MELVFAFATDDGDTLKNDGHFGNAGYYSIYRISSDKAEFIEKRKNMEIEEDEGKIHGDPNKAKSVSSVLKGINVLVSEQFGPNITRIIKKFACVVIRKSSLIKDVIKVLQSNMESITAEYQKGEDRKPLILTLGQVS